MNTTLASAALAIATGLVTWAAPLAAQDATLTFSFNGERMTIRQSTSVTAAKLVQFAAIPSRCDGICAAPHEAAHGVETVGEREVLEFLRFAVEPGLGLVIDARTPDLRRAGYIPSSINVPLVAVAVGNPYRDQIFEALGGRATGSGWDFSRAYALVIYATGPGTMDAADLIAKLVAAGYPPAKLKFYRGGMQTWAGLGLTYAEPNS